MRIAVFDTETTGLDKPFCYNIGYAIYDTETMETLCKKEFIVEQIWHNMALFASAYYAEKRPIYVNRMKARKIKMSKFGYICQEMIRDFKQFEVTSAYAYNSSFDEKVFNFNCDWYKCSNPFDTIPIFDIRGYVHHFIAFTKDFQAFCETNERFTESGNYSTTAETVFQYFSNNADFEEEHTALADSEIELVILVNCVTLGAEWEKAYKVYQSIPRETERELMVIVDNEECFSFSYKKKSVRNGNIYLKTK